MKLGTLKPRIATLDTSRLRSVAELKPRGTGRLRGKAGVEARERILLRDKYTCQCGCKRVGLPDQLEVDHHIPLYLGGADTDDNKRTMLRECHAKKTSRERSEVALGSVNPNGRYR